ncbi:hypothetical protein K466DRAFT_358769 [Polyporus arcularius HHB13444]|uniref:C2H2-type domain-containing protein n=1 Tax=Polyporus arcularius HHB13444 TaxID=1314778 RepID=A0A5C3PSV6_9APHY|nr:hypothetical protein K466DRAFT_358769 [Polyporus arcularius HHB13444]
MYDARKCDIYASTPSVSISEFEVDWYDRLASQDGFAVPPPPTTDMTASAVTDASSDTPSSVPFSEFEVDTDAWLASQDSFPVAPPPTTALASAGPSDMGENYQAWPTMSPWTAQSTGRVSPGDTIFSTMPLLPSSGSADSLANFVGTLTPTPGHAQLCGTSFTTIPPPASAMSETLQADVPAMAGPSRTPRRTKTPQSVGQKGKLYQCESCEVSCTRKFNLRQHIREHHDSTFQKFKCEHCGKKYVRSNELRRHVRSRHPDDVANVSQ